MPRMNGTGPEGKGVGTGRGLGKCKDHSEEKNLEKLGRGMGKRRHSGEEDEGRGERLRSGRDNIKQ